MCGKVLLFAPEHGGRERLMSLMPTIVLIGIRPADAARHNTKDPWLAGLKVNFCAVRGDTSGRVRINLYISFPLLLVLLRVASRA